MKKRVISGLAIVAIIIVTLFLFDTLIFVGLAGLISAMGVYEMSYSTGFVKDKVLLGLSMLFAGAVPFLFSIHLKYLTFIIVFVYASLMCTVFLIRHNKIKFESFCVAFLVSLFIPTIISFFIIIRDTYENLGMFYMLITLGGTWIADVGAFFTGTFLGKTKLAPTISPNKTVEGFFGGVALSICFCLILGKIFIFATPIIYSGVNIQVNYLYLAIAGVIAACIGLCGDLFASIIKRQTGIKDYGNIIPGHGGILDRFDSVLFVTPVMYFFVTFFPVAIII